ncbi:MAG: sulfatase [Myxococcota bacterium]
MLITVDTLRADHLGIYGYTRRTSPRVDGLFREGTVFENSYSAEARTPQSVISILSGRLPQEHGVRAFSQLVPQATKLIPDLLPPAYQRAGFVGNAVLTHEATDLGDRFDHFDEFLDSRVPNSHRIERRAGRLTDAALLWLADGRDPARPLFLWLHYMDPHRPYRAPECRPLSFSHDEPHWVSPDDPAAFDLYKEVEEGVKAVDGLDFVDAYDEEIAYLDAQLGRLLDGFARHTSLDRTLVILTADHGESMLEHEIYFAHGYHVYEKILRVPFLLRGPGFGRKRRAGLVSGIDVAPTVLGFAGARIPEEMRGLDLGAARRVDSKRVVFAETTIRGFMGVGFDSRFWRAAIQGDRKWFLGFSADSTRLLERWFIDLHEDPGETSPRAWRDSRAAKTLLALAEADPVRGDALKRFERGRIPSVPIVDPRATRIQRERLRALGYLE